MYDSRMDQYGYGLYVRLGRFSTVIPEHGIQYDSRSLWDVPSRLPCRGPSYLVRVPGENSAAHPI